MTEQRKPAPRRRAILRGMGGLALTTAMSGAAPAGTAEARTRPKPSIVMLHGAFSGAWSFDVSRTAFEEQGWDCTRPI